MTVSEHFRSAASQGNQIIGIIRRNITYCWPTWIDRNHGIMSVYLYASMHICLYVIIYVCMAVCLSDCLSLYALYSIKKNYSGTSPYGHLTIKKTSQLQSPWLSPKLYSTVKITPCKFNKVTSSLRSHLPSHVGDLNSEVPQYNLISLIQHAYPERKPSSAVTQ